MSESQDIADCVVAWLGYKQRTGLGNLLNEGSMAVPIAEYLAAQHGRDIAAEVPHPLFENSGKGRPRQIDFVRHKRNETTWHAAYETKFKTMSFEKIVHDICRLVCLAQVPEKIGRPARYFVYAAKTPEKHDVLMNSFNFGGGRIPYFDGILDRGKDKLGKSVTFKLIELHAKQREPFESFAKDYATELPSAVKTTVKGWAEFGGFTCGVWQVLAAKGSKLVSAKDLKT